MRRPIRKVLLAVLVLVAPVAFNARGQDANTIVNAAAQALGTSNLLTLKFSGSGTINTFGQSWKHDVGWPEFKLINYAASIDYQVPAMQVDFTRDNPEKGKPMQGGGYPLLTPQKVSQSVSGKLAWDAVGGSAPINSPSANDRVLEIWSTPQGVIKAAQMAGSGVTAQVVKNSQGAVIGAVLVFPLGGTTFTVTLTKDNLVSRVEYTTDTAMLGDTVTKVLYTDYQDFGGFKFPTKMVRLQGGVPSVQLDSYQTLTLAVDKVTPNATVSISVPPSMQEVAASSPIPPAVDKLADGVYLLSGQGPNSVAVELSDYVVLVEAPEGDALTMARFDALRKQIPGKPVRYVVSTHHHFDHAGGVRAAVAEGATLIVPGWSRVFYDRVLLAPHSLNPDLLAKTPRKPAIEEVGTAFGSERDMLELTDGKRAVRVYRVLGSQEADAMLFVYLPSEKMLVEADMFTPESKVENSGKDGGAGKRDLPLILTPEPLVLYNNIKRLNLDVETVVPLHGHPAKITELLAAIGGN